MLTKEIAPLVEDYLSKTYSLTDEDLKYLENADKLILICSVHPEEAKKRSEQLLYTADELFNCMATIFETDCGVSPRLLQYQERYYQLYIMYAKANELQGMYLDSLSLLCFTSSFDLYYLQEIKNKK